MPPPHEPLSTGCLLGDIGDFLVDVLVVTSELAQVLVKGHRIRNHTTRLLSVLSGEPDLRTTDYLDDKHEALKQITSHICEARDKIHSIWQSTPPVPPNLSANHWPPDPSRAASLAICESSSTPFPRGFPPMMSAGSDGLESPDTHPNLFRNEDGAALNSPVMSEGAESSHGNPGDDYEQNEDVPSLEQLSSRGTGSYKCPYGASCTKGGLLPDKSFKIFTRNSDFKSHMLKHEKIYKCNLPHCNNRGKGFARPDQLKRHQLTVKHEPR